MWKQCCIAMAVTLLAASASTQTAFPDVRGTWKGESESIVAGTANPHHVGPSQAEPRLSSVPFTMIIDKQDGRRFSGTFSSPHSTEQIVGVISQTGTLFYVDSDGYGYGTLMGPDRWESCYLQVSATGGVASCTVMTKVP